jgi:hypothetical protein
MRRPSQPPPVRPRRGAFTVLELLLGVSLLTLIVFGLYSVFDQTQRALRSSVQQVDIFESARAATALIREDVSQYRPAGVPWRAGLAVIVSSNLPPVPLADLSGDFQGWLSSQEIYGVHRVGGEWRGVGYWLDFDTNTLDTVRIATLMRFQQSLPERQFAAPHSGEGRRHLFPMPFDRLGGELTPGQDGLNPFIPYDPSEFNNWSQVRTNIAYSSAVIPGIVHFRVLAYDQNGVVLRTPLPRSPRPGEPPTRPDPAFTSRFEMAHTQFGEMQYRFTGEVLPAQLELELGLVEPATAERLRSFTTPEGAARYLRENAGKVHFFRQRIPLANAPRS